MLEAARRMPRAPIFGIATYQVDGRFVDFTVGWADFDRDIDWAYEQLLAAGVRSDDHVLVTASNHEGPWISPIIRALRRIGATYTPAEVYGWDATRFISLIDRLPITVIIGVAEESLDAVAAQKPDLPEFLRDVRTIWARPGAYDRLVEEGVECLPMVLLGPALGLGHTPAVNEVLIDGAGWDVREVGGELSVSSTSARHDDVTDAPTGVAGRVIETGATTRVQL
ncbi:hypothetical protein GORHZ_169_00140 [Gordonia rhizosphera NBRC 16068]|uniref:AMP-dependent synthetase/ligase domain-containing protein n=2 Tax=Gordonia rhizosphera TaxID=83341 RepID=K6V7R9_9ACTN|nr:hypothetical protein GORHZ_169_00140 [Gordonia rhizosphera NBRC 16068]